MKTYLGDSVYVDDANGELVLTTENGGPPSNVICLEPAVYNALVRFVERRHNPTLSDGRSTWEEGP